MINHWKELLMFIGIAAGLLLIVWGEEHREDGGQEIQEDPEVSSKSDRMTD